MEHKQIPPEHMHAPHAWRVLGTPEREALEVVEGDLGKYCWQTGDNSEWTLVGHSPAVWRKHIGPGEVQALSDAIGDISGALDVINGEVV